LCPADANGKKATQGCPCGYLGSTDFQCRCSPLQVERYLAKISGPLLDRISIHITVRPVDIEALRGVPGGESSASMRERVTAAQSIQRRRFASESDGAGPRNADIPESAFRELCPMEDDAEELLFGAQKRLRISARGRVHIVRVARTIADLEGSDRISVHDVAEAIQYRIREVR
jgi:magnesium chelatase family protein